MGINTLSPKVVAATVASTAAQGFVTIHDMPHIVSITGACKNADLVNYANIS